jgi:DNA polymerase elongation subunit (family B)
MPRRLIKRAELPPTAIEQADARPEVLNVTWAGDSLLVVERDPDGSTRIRNERAPYCAFVETLIVGPEFARALRNDIRVHEVREEGKYTRISFKRRDQCLDICQALQGNGMPTYEGDVNPVRRWMTDRMPRLGNHRIVYLDIETDSRLPFSRKEEMRVLCWAIEGADGVRKVGVLEENTDAAEAQLLQRLLNELQRYDLIAAWNGDRFDFPVLQARFEKRRLSFVAARWLWLDQMVIFQRMNMMAAESGEEKTSFKLGDIATALLGEGKDDFDAAKTWEAWHAGGDERRRMVRYCVKDTNLLKRVEEKTGYIGLLHTLAETCNVFPDTRGANPTIQAEGFLLALGAAQGYRFPTAKVGIHSEKYKGAYVMEPQCKGITKNVHVADFAGLYPSIIVTWNMSPETLVQGELHKQLSDEYAQTGKVPWGYSYVTLTGCFFRTDVEGILPRAVKEVMRLRKYWNKLKASLPPGTPEWVAANRKATAYKIAANSFYGVVGSPLSRFFSRDVAESVTQAGAWLIIQTIDAATARGMTAVYGDTDSVFIAGTNRTEFEVFVEWCNVDLYPAKLVELGCPENLIDLAYEKEFERVVFSCAKKYAGRYVHFKGTAATADSKPEVKGLEFKRGDSLRLARNFQAEVVDLLVGMTNGGHEDPLTFVEVVERWQQRILHGELTLEDVQLSKRLNKELGQYAQKVKNDGEMGRQLPHIEIAKQLLARGHDMGEGVKVHYFIADAKHPDGPLYLAAEDWQGQCDRWEVWDRMVYPPTERLLTAAFPTFDWAPWGKTRPKMPRKRKVKEEAAE